MQNALDTIIGEKQSIDIKTITILHALSTLCDIIDVLNKLNKNLSVIYLDFLKAFDRVDWDFILSALQNLWIWRQIYSHG